MKFIKRASVEFHNFMWNDHECKILFIIWLLKMVYPLKGCYYFKRKHNVVTEAIMTLHASNVWPFDIYDMTLATE